MEKLEIFKQVGRNIQQIRLSLYRIAQALEVHLTDLVANNTAKVTEK